LLFYRAPATPNGPDVRRRLVRLSNGRRYVRHYWPVTGLRQPHLQPVSWQRHAFFGHPQEQDRQSQVPQQFVVAIFFEVVFFKLGIVFFLFLFFSA
jgi:hypothetical protein